MTATVNINLGWISYINLALVYSKLFHAKLYIFQTFLSDFLKEKHIVFLFNLHKHLLYL